MQALALCALNTTCNAKNPTFTALWSSGDTFQKQMEFFCFNNIICVYMVSTDQGHAQIYIGSTWPSLGRVNINILDDYANTGA